VTGDEDSWGGHDKGYYREGMPVALARIKLSKTLVRSKWREVVRGAWCVVRGACWQAGVVFQQLRDSDTRRGNVRRTKPGRGGVEWELEAAGGFNCLN
jgi:hypothetical protein